MKENNNLLLSDLSDSTILRENESLLSLLLKDHTTGKNIKWGTDSYTNHGYSFQDDQEIKIDLITGWYEGFIRPRVDKDLDIQLKRQRNRAEVFTPSWVIRLQVDAALKDMEELSLVDFIKTKWLEITCGEAPYMVNRYDMETGEVISLKDRAGFIDVKFKKLNEAIESEEEWLKLAVEIYKASYGYEYQGDSLLLARENLILTFIDNYFYMFGAFPKEKLLLEITKIISLNVFQMDGLTYEVPYSDGGVEQYGTQLSLFEVEEVKEEVAPNLAKMKLWDKNKLIKYKELLERNDLEMKFDVVIGNPPYQDETIGENKTYAPPIYHEFMDSAHKIGTKTVLITPGRFLYNIGGTPKKWNRKMLNNKHFKVLEYISDSTTVFKDTDIKGGICISYYDRNKDFSPIGTFIPFTHLQNITDKVVNYNIFLSLNTIMYASEVYKFTEKLHDDFPEAETLLSKGHKYDLKSNIFERLSIVFYKQKPNDGLEYVKVFGRMRNEGRTYRWIRRDYLTEPSNFNKWKVFIPQSNGSGKLGEVLSTPLVETPLIGHTQTFMSVGAFESKLEAEACMKYIKTKFSRVMLGVLKVTQGNPLSTWEYVPLQDFTPNSDIDWSMSISEIDQQLYEKYNLNEEEINFIEKNVKEME